MLSIQWIDYMRIYEDFNRIGLQPHYVEKQVPIQLFIIKGKIYKWVYIPLHAFRQT